MVKFTTGPWGWNMAEDGVGTIYGGPIDARRPIADFWRKPLRIASDARFDSELKAEQIANLDLCAAAPDLYEALANLIAADDDWNGSGDDDDRCAVAREEARAALAKATLTTPQEAQS